MAQTQVSESQFGEAVGHRFKLRNPLAKVTCKKCADCASDVYAHGFHEVDVTDLQKILDICADTKPSFIEPGLLVGGFKSAIEECKRDPNAVVVNCAGKKLNTFFPKTKNSFDALRASGRLVDLEWDDTPVFQIPLQEVLSTIIWMKEQVTAGKSVVVNCAQGKSRSGYMAMAYLMSVHDLSMAEALKLVQTKRPFVQPNPGFLQQLKDSETEIRTT
eukprot:m.125874 g.125874  ORF g.125874 m.125874 type:complete len:217 (+) comp29161_c1_seq1:129-779(+)